MKVSILIISKNRKADLHFTLNRLNTLIDKSIHEVLVLLDGCEDDSNMLVKQLPWVNWTVLNKSIGASAAREILYKKSQGDILIGFDDDAHPLQNNFIEIVEDQFNKDESIGVIAFQEIKGIYKNDSEALASKPKKQLHYLCKEFVGCGFAIKKSTYFNTRGFPVWVDIYGEESCVSIEVIANGEKILYTNNISVNHRVDMAARKKAGNNYFRFEKQLKNTLFYYLVYYKYPAIKILKLIYHNFFKYAIKDFSFFKGFVFAISQAIFKFPNVLKYRKPIATKFIELKDKLPSPIFY
ncbi:glycosyltransferase family 2 protein [Lacinutrix algicola]|uniref:glycosyltransferase family 2 protein n=1 Tax=Lacinutrix algicola TaxID=342954 RepID=UPI0009F85378|nr:glycosyltransferase [Lacinutrix algicola]